jgi:dTDP-4-amino-4,6-dideoxygalactose transaminase
MSFSVLHPEREALARALRDRGVDSDLGFMADCSSLPLFAEDGACCPHSARTAREILHLPIYPQLEPHHLDRVATAVRAALDGV